jgi:hypothetical protein
MSTVYIGDTLVNDIFLGSARIGEPNPVNLTLVTSGLTAYFDAAYSASSVNWKSTTGKYTASFLKTIYQSSPPQYYEITGSISDITYGDNENLNSASLSGTGSRTVMVWINPSSGSADSNILWYGNPAGNKLLFEISSGSIGQNYLKIANDTSSSIATANGAVSLGNWQMATYTTNGTNTFSGINIWLNSNKQSIAGATTWDIDTTGIRYWETGTVNSSLSYLGKIGAHLVYNRTLTDAEIIQNVNYFKSRFGIP